jgi:hypothetical protein
MSNPIDPVAADAAGAHSRTLRPTGTRWPEEHLLQLSFGYVMSSALHVAIELAIADRLADGPCDVATLAAAAGCDEQSLYRMLRALAGAAVFQEVAPRRFALTPAARLLRRDVEGPRDLVRWISHPAHFHIYAELLGSVISGRPAAERVFGKPVFEHLRDVPALSEVFNAAMTSLSATTAAAILEAYDFAGIETLVDVGGGHGHLLSAILARYPAMTGILADLAHVVEGAAARLPGGDVGGRLRTRPADFFREVPAGGDAYLLKHILHDWDDGRAGAILGHVRAALGGTAGGTLLVIEAVIKAGNDADFAKLVDVEMLATHGGRERTAEEFAELLRRNGFALRRIVPTGSAVSVLEATPA